MINAPAPGAQVRGEGIAEIVARRVSQDIVSGRLLPGTRLTEETLAQAYSVSRTPIREALILLSGSGLVELTRNRGATVLQLSAADVLEIYHLRALLESESAAPGRQAGLERSGRPVAEELRPTRRAARGSGVRSARGGHLLPLQHRRRLGQSTPLLADPPGLRHSRGVPVEHRVHAGRHGGSGAAAPRHRDGDRSPSIERRRETDAPPHLLGRIDGGRPARSPPEGGVGSRRPIRVSADTPDGGLEVR